MRDGGSGFVSGRGGYGQGILNMRERLEAVGGALEIRSVPQAGTSVMGKIAPL